MLVPLPKANAVVPVKDASMTPFALYRFFKAGHTLDFSKCVLPYPAGAFSMMLLLSVEEAEEEEFYKVLYVYVCLFNVLGTN